MNNAMTHTPSFSPEELDIVPAFQHRGWKIAVYKENLIRATSYQYSVVLRANANGANLVVFDGGNMLFERQVKGITTTLINAVVDYTKAHQTVVES
jgi:hypothetical protein